MEIHRDTTAHSRRLSNFPAAADMVRLAELKIEMFSANQMATFILSRITMFGIMEECAVNKTK